MSLNKISNFKNTLKNLTIQKLNIEINNAYQ